MPPRLPPNAGVEAALNAPPSTEPVGAALGQMRSIMDELRGAARDICGQYLSAREAARVAETKRDVLQQLDGRSLAWDNLDPVAVERMVECMVETSGKMGRVIEGVRLSLGRLRCATEGSSSESMRGAWWMTRRVEPLIEKLGVAHGVVAGLVDVVRRESREEILYELRYGEAARGLAVAKLVMLMELWTWLGEWLDQLVVLREAVVSVREDVADKRIQNGLDTVRQEMEEGSKEGSEGSEEMDLETEEDDEEEED
ncbi:hypothetical protein V502_01393 [Pseudogymnoascus sp. VKM F-4520 (FW-2644)]|nr:hypothetical protein V502_01393 [Pseudogymnoascus sp. VKM F-4520 (FW-2644)]